MLENMGVKEKCVPVSRIAFKREETVLTDSVDTGGEGGAVVWPKLDVSFALNGETMPGFEPAEGDVVKNEAGEAQPAMGGWPSTEIAFAVPEDDMPRVRAWFSGDYHGVTVPQSIALTKNMTAAVYAALDAFRHNADARDLFLSPFRIAWSFRFTDGSYSPLNDVKMLVPNSEAPLLPVFSHYIGDKRLQTRTVIRTIPSRLTASLSLSSGVEFFPEEIESVDIFATMQTAAYEPAESIDGLRNITIDGARKRCWYYSRLQSAEIQARAEVNNAFRLIGSIPAADVISGVSGFKLSVPSKNKPLFSSLPQYGDTPGGAVCENGGRHIVLESEPLHLGYPEGEKRLQRVSLRGVFDRNRISVAVYGAVHRGDWRLVAIGNGPHISGIAGVACRWYKIRIEYDTRQGDFLDYIMFRFAVR